MLEWSFENVDLSYLEKLEAGVWILNCGDPAVGVDGNERFFFHVTKFQELAFVGNAKLFADDGHTPRVRALESCINMRSTGGNEDSYRGVGV